MNNKTRKTHAWKHRKTSDYVYFYGDKCKTCGLIFFDYTFNGYFHDEIYSDEDGNKILNISCNDYLMQQVMK